MRYRSIRPVKSMEDILLPFKITFTRTIEGGVNNNAFRFPANQEVTISKQEYEAIAHSSYAEELGH